MLPIRGGYRQSLTIALIAALAIVGWAYRDSYLSIVQKWTDDTAFSHGFLILPITLWLLWRRRAELAESEARPSWLGVGLLVVLVMLWVVARGTGVLVVEQYAVVAILPSMFLAILGPSAAKCVAFPLAFLLFAVPSGHSLVPFLMEVTADIATWALRLSGIPVYRSHMFISIPAGDFEVAHACSGLNYVITGAVVGVLYAYLAYAGWRKRLLCVLAFLTTLILANGFRVYLTIAVSHLTDMKFGPGDEHVTFGRVLFVLVVLAMIWAGRPWHDAAPQARALPAPAPAGPNGRDWTPALLAILVTVIGPSYLSASMTRAQAQASEIDARLSLPTARPPWRDPQAGPLGWKPRYVGAAAERSGVYAAADGSSVDVFVGVYGLGRTSESEMISDTNRIESSDGRSLADEGTRNVTFAGDGALSVRERLIHDGGQERLVWYWFVVGSRPVVSELRVKALEALAFARQKGTTERIVTISTTSDAAASERLHAFVDAYGWCLATGFAAGECG